MGESRAARRSSSSRSTGICNVVNFRKASRARFGGCLKAEVFPAQNTRSARTRNAARSAALEPLFTAFGRRSEAARASLARRSRAARQGTARADDGRCSGPAQTPPGIDQLGPMSTSFPHNRPNSACHLRGQSSPTRLMSNNDPLPLFVSGLLFAAPAQGGPRYMRNCATLINTTPERSPCKSCKCSASAMVLRVNRESPTTMLLCIPMPTKRAWPAMRKCPAPLAHEGETCHAEQSAFREVPGKDGIECDRTQDLNGGKAGRLWKLKTGELLANS